MTEAAFLLGGFMGIRIEERPNLATLLTGHHPKTQNRFAEFFKWYGTLPELATTDPVVKPATERLYWDTMQKFTEFLRDTHRINILPGNIAYSGWENDELRFNYDAGDCRFHFSFPEEGTIRVRGVVTHASPYLVDLSVGIYDIIQPKKDGVKVPLVRWEERGALAVAAVQHLYDVGSRLGHLRTALGSQGDYPRIKNLEIVWAEGDKHDIDLPEYKDELAKLAEQPLYQDIFRKGYSEILLPQT